MRVFLRNEIEPFKRTCARSRGGGARAAVLHPSLFPPPPCSSVGLRGQLRCAGFPMMRAAQCASLHAFFLASLCACWHACALYRIFGAQHCRVRRPPPPTLTGMCPCLCMIPRPYSRLFCSLLQGLLIAPRTPCAHLLLLAPVDVATSTATAHAMLVVLYVSASLALPCTHPTTRASKSSLLAPVHVPLYLMPTCGPVVHDPLFLSLPLSSP